MGLTGLLLHLVLHRPIGFDDIVHVAAAVAAMSQGFTDVDGVKTGSKKYVLEFECFLL